MPLNINDFMKYRVKIFSILSALPILVFAAPSDHGRPRDDPSYHSSPLSKIFVPIAIIILIILAIGWIGNNKEKFGGILKNLFSIICVGALIFGFIILPSLDRCGRESSTQSPTVNQQNVDNSTYSNSQEGNQQSNPNYNNEKHIPQEGEVGYKTKTYRIDVCRYCHGSGKKTIEANWGTTTIQCPTCHGTGREKIAGNYR